MLTTLVTEAEIIDQSKPVQALLNNPPKVLPQLTALLDWIIKIGFTLVGLIANLTKPIMDQQEDLAESTRQAKAHSMPASLAAATSTLSTSRGTNASAPKRCNQCHAHGHTVNECQTTNPMAMRRRVAQNNRIAKEARQQQGLQISNVPPSFYLRWQHLSPHHFPLSKCSTPPLLQMPLNSEDGQHNWPVTNDIIAALLNLLSCLWLWGDVEVLVTSLVVLQVSQPFLSLPQLPFCSTIFPLCNHSTDFLCNPSVFFSTFVPCLYIYKPQVPSGRSPVGTHLNISSSLLLPSSHLQCPAQMSSTLQS